MTDNLRIYDLGRSVPESAKRTIAGGRLKGKTDINPVWRIKKLTELFGPCGSGWYYKVTRQWTEAAGDEVAAFVNIELYVRMDGEWSQPIFGTGGSMFVTKERAGLNVSDECYKMATTDAISVACKSLGIAADVYWEQDSTKYVTETPPDCDAVNRPNDRLRQDVGGGTIGGGTTGPSPTAQAAGVDQSAWERLAPVAAELNRIGYTTASVCKTYNLKSIYDMSDLQIRNFLKKAASLPTRTGA